MCSNTVRVKVGSIAKLLANISLLSREWTLFYESLAMQKNRRHEFEAEFARSNYDSFKLFTSVLEQWVGEKGSAATVELLATVLNEIHHKDAAEQLLNKYGAAYVTVSGDAEESGSNTGTMSCSYGSTKLNKSEAAQTNVPMNEINKSTPEFTDSDNTIETESKTNGEETFAEEDCALLNIITADSSSSSENFSEDLDQNSSSTHIGTPSHEASSGTENGTPKIQPRIKLIIALICLIFIIIFISMLLSVGYIKFKEETWLQNKHLTDNTATINEPPSTTESAIAANTSPFLSSTLGDTTTTRSENTATPMSSVIHNSSNSFPPQSLGKKKTKKRSQKILASVPYQLKNKAEAICDSNIRTHIVFYNANSYDFMDHPYDCPARIDGISFVHTSWFLEQIGNLLNLTSNLSRFVINGPDICNRNEGYRNTLSGDISLYHLEHLEFLNLNGPTSSPTADCTELFSWLASYEVKDVTLKSLSFWGVMFTPKNREDIHQLCVKAFNSNRLTELNILASSFNVEMFKFKRVLPSKSFKTIGFFTTNPINEWATKSLFNFINYFLNGSTTDSFSTNITLPYETFRQSVKALHSLRAKTVEISVFIEDCDIVNFEFLHEIPNVLKFQMKLLFTVKCQNRSRMFPIKFQRLGHLASSKNYHTFRLISNAHFHPEGASDLHCREYIKKNAVLTLDRNLKC